MRAIVAPRRGGKTTQLIRECAKHRYALIVCISHREAQNVFRQAIEMGAPIPMPITYEEFGRHQYAPHNVEAFYFDNVDLYLQSRTIVPVMAITVTDEAPSQGDDDGNPHSY